MRITRILKKNFFWSLMIVVFIMLLNMADKYILNKNINNRLKKVEIINIDMKTGKVENHLDKENYKKSEINDVKLFNILENNNKKSELYFLEAYKNLYEDNYAEAENNLLMSLKSTKKSTSTLSTIYSSRLLAQIYMSRKDFSKSAELVKYSLKSFNTLDINMYYKEILDFTNIVNNNEYGRDKIISWGKEILSVHHKLSKEAKIHINFKLKDLYIENGNYAEASEHIISAYYRAVELKDNYYIAKSIMDLASIFRELGDFEKSIELINKALNISIENKIERKYIELQGNVNLAVIYTESRKYNEAQAYLDNINSSKEYITDKENKRLEMVRSIIYAEIEFDRNNIEEGKKRLDYVYELMRSCNCYLAEYVYLDYYISYAKYLKLSGKNDESIELYNGISKWFNENNYFYNKKRIAKRLADVSIYDGKLWIRGEGIDLLNDSDSPYRSYIHYIQDSVKSQIIIEKDKEKISFIAKTLFILSIIGIKVFLTYNKKVKKLRKLNEEDGLTKSYNRVHFDRIYQEYLNRQSDFALIMIDIDNFKKLNDKYGHQFGDHVLKRMCRLIMKTIDSDMELSRYGGEEFIITAQNKSKEQVRNSAEIIRREIENLIWSKDVKVTISIGISMSYENKEDTLSRADENLYIAKATGKNKVIG
ncbi:MAG: diguanylate cyclase [Clostridium sp.]